MASESCRARWVAKRPSRNDVVAAAAMAAYGAVIWFFGIPCFFQKLTGIHCPGCGGTRAVKALAQLDLALALHQNLWAVLFAIPALGLYGITKVIETPTWYERFTNRYLWVTGIAAIPFVILRNIPVWPLNLMAPLP